MNESEKDGKIVSFNPPTGSPVRPEPRIVTETDLLKEEFLQLYVVRESGLSAEELTLLNHWIDTVLFDFEHARGEIAKSLSGGFDDKEFEYLVDGAARQFPTRLAFTEYVFGRERLYKSLPDEFYDNQQLQDCAASIYEIAWLRLYKSIRSMNSYLKMRKMDL